ncbi:4-hydroxy-3-methylbut-2-enyl diphosphate reductase [Kosmotoga pacifica]|uniref:4-hydroxy-3-methylbut-2-enyl diphosphate reductase n=1 Tax=Kosmotoga pacifica TaxID=1330330 RepID=A0A0G2Z5D1_9BACT|nr:4-hydroxy-3-methylbut-2-enyl diphosphate reductase [Kosmotoga pacifica]AKI96777.1 hypothetical protein IX53_01900 [Kosmotoga pacifica]
MKIYMAASTGFCYGVNRAVTTCERLLKSGVTLYSQGELVHNEEVVKHLRKLGLKVLNNGKFPLKPEQGSAVVIRAHGVPPNIESALKKSFERVIDLTCPIVYNVFRLAEKLEKQGKLLVIFGRKDHAEVNALCGRVKNYVIVEPGYDPSTVYSTILKKATKRIALISQTTMDHREFMDFAEQVKLVVDLEVEIFDTICNVTVKREEEARELATRCAAVVVVGGKHSSNTKKLVTIVEKSGKPAFHVRSPEELPPLQEFESVGIISGTSTPYTQIQRILDYIETKYEGEVIHNG